MLFKNISIPFSASTKLCQVLVKVLLKHSIKMLRKLFKILQITYHFCSQNVNKTSQENSQGNIKRSQNLPATLKCKLPEQVIFSVPFSERFSFTGQETYCMAFVPRNNGKPTAYVHTTSKEPNVLTGK